MVVGIAIAAGTIALWPTRSSRSDVSDGTVEVRRGDLKLEVTATGSLGAEKSVDVTPPSVEDMWDFKIAKLVNEGVQVKQGEMLVEFDSQQVMRELMDRTAELNKTQEELHKRKLEYDIQMRDLRVQHEQSRVNAEKARNKAKLDPSLGALQDYRQAQIELEQAETEYKRVDEKMQATVRMQKAELSSLENNLTKAKTRVERDKNRLKALTVTAPIDGIVVFKKDWRGERKQVGQTAWRAEPIMQLPDLTSLRLEATVEEANAGRVAVGQSTTIRLDAFPEEKLTGRLVSIGAVLRTKRWDMPVKVVDAIIALDRRSDKLLPGMTASAQIEVERIPNVLLVPLKAVQERQGGARVRVAVPTGGFEDRPIKAGRRNSEFLEVLEGLKEGERVLAR